MQDQFIVLASKESITSAKIKAQLVIGPQGEIKSIQVVESSNPQLNPLAIEALKHLQCTGQGIDVTVSYPIEFRIAEDTPQ